MSKYEGTVCGAKAQKWQRVLHFRDEKIKTLTV